MAAMQTMRRYRTEQERIDDLTMKIENPNVVGSGFIAHPPQRPFQQPLMQQPPTVAHMEYPEEFAGYKPPAAAAAASARPAPVTYVAPTYTTRPAGTPSHAAVQPRPAASVNASGPGTYRPPHLASQSNAGNVHQPAYNNAAGPVPGARPAHHAPVPAAVPRLQVQQSNHYAPRNNTAVPNRGYGQPQPSQRPQAQAYPGNQPARAAPTNAPMRGYNAPPQQQQQRPQAVQQQRPQAVQQRPVTAPGTGAAMHHQPQANNQQRMPASTAAPHSVPRAVQSAVAAHNHAYRAAPQPQHPTPAPQQRPTAIPQQRPAVAQQQRPAAIQQQRPAPVQQRTAVVPPSMQPAPVPSVQAVARHVEDDDDDDMGDGSKLTKGQAKRLRKKKREAHLKQGV